MDNDIFQTLCTMCTIGIVQATPYKVSGGLLHTMWHVKTNTGRYAVKELNKNIINRKDALDYYELSEQIAAYFFDAGIPTIKAIRCVGKSVVKIEQYFFIVYPWVDGEPLAADRVDKEKARIIGSTLATIHGLRLNLSEMSTLQFRDIIADRGSDDDLKKLYNEAIKHDIKIGIAQDVLRSYYANYSDAMHKLQNDMIISHGDLDQKNVLWVNDQQPVIIDWEGAHMMNPTHEIICVALDWSGVQYANVNIDIFSAVIKTYMKAGGFIKSEYIQMAFSAIIGNWIGWLNFNIERILKQYPMEEQLLAKKEIDRTSQIIQYLFKNMDFLQDIISDIVKCGF